jgi:hypothetical protein
MLGPGFVLNYAAVIITAGILRVTSGVGLIPPVILGDLIGFAVNYNFSVLYLTKTRFWMRFLPPKPTSPLDSLFQLEAT